jgi:hypothetical protein
MLYRAYVTPLGCRADVAFAKSLTFENVFPGAPGKDSGCMLREPTPKYGQSVSASNSSVARTR